MSGAPKQGVVFNTPKPLSSIFRAEIEIRAMLAVQCPVTQTVTVMIHVVFIKKIFAHSVDGWVHF